MPHDSPVSIVAHLLARTGVSHWTTRAVCQRGIGGNSDELQPALAALKRAARKVQTSFGPSVISRCACNCPSHSRMSSPVRRQHRQSHLLVHAQCYSFRPLRTCRRFLVSFRVGRGTSSIRKLTPDCRPLTRPGLRPRECLAHSARADFLLGHH